ncbi:MAG: hypothetical protein GC165_06425 [Armatimonadetes bacterium]|nr:hypothetical protein [Armatimonadota bacterium]
MTRRVPLQRPGGKLPSKQERWWQIVEPLGRAVALILVPIATFFDHRIGGLVVLSPAFLGFIISLTLMLIIPLRREFQSRSRYTDQLSEFGEPIVHVAPTVDGWVALGEDWIGVTSFPTTRRNLKFGEIDNVYFGGPRGRWDQVKKSPNATLPKQAIDANTKLTWVLLLHEADPSKSVLLVFRTEWEQKTWLEICQSAMERGRPALRVKTRPQPSPRQVLSKTRFWPVLVSGLVFTLAFIVCMLITDVHLKERSVQIVINFLFFSAILQFWSPMVAVSSIPLTQAFEVALENQSSKPILGPICLVGDKLYLRTPVDSRDWAESIPLTDIAEVRLEDWGHFWSYDDIFDLLRRKDNPLRKVIRLVLRRATDSEREVMLPTATAEDLFHDLRERISPERSPA